MTAQTFLSIRQLTRNWPFRETRSYVIDRIISYRVVTRNTRWRGFSVSSLFTRGYNHVLRNIHPVYCVARETRSLTREFADFSTARNILLYFERLDIFGFEPLSFICGRDWPERGTKKGERGNERIVAGEPDLRQYAGVGGIPSKPPRDSASLSLPSHRVFVIKIN